ncbi:hypothetical protein RND81_12G008200 [Saponaria officinalis]|uniref:Calcineurin-like phosphoesterase domain-containing protein n=1 Tax=Saponaria officinalis TaxID=3572 RepID=A0AAW1H1R5_SAPOF
MNEFVVDLVVYLGDVITANNIATTNASVYWEMAISPTRERNIPWASVFGNHDDAPFEWPLDWFSQSNVPPLNCPSTISTSSVGEDDCSFKGTTRLELMSNEIDSNKLSFSRKGPRNLWPGVSNYVLNISSSNNSQRPVAYLYFLDSGGGSYPEVISNAQAKWFSRTSREINPDARVPEIVFWHIPSRAYQTVAASGKIGKPCVGSINEENVAPQEAEFGIMKALEERPSVQGTTMDSIGVALATTFGFVLRGTPVTVAMEIGLEELGSLKLKKIHFHSNLGLLWKMVLLIVMLS